MIEIYERTIIRGETYTKWRRQTPGKRWVYWLTRGELQHDPVVVSPTSSKQVDLWIVAHRMHGHAPIVD